MELQEWRQIQVLKKKARAQVHAKLRRGEWTRPTVCQTCGRDVEKGATKTWHTDKRHKMTVAHHWNGWDHPLDVWWICYRCNTVLARCHDGTITLEQAKGVVRFGYVYRADLTDAPGDRLGLRLDGE
jgi:protein-arginine kinase activator protein McsA